MMAAPERLTKADKVSEESSVEKGWGLLRIMRDEDRQKWKEKNLHVKEERLEITGKKVCKREMFFEWEGQSGSSPQFGSDGLFSLACTEQLEQYSC